MITVSELAKDLKVSTSTIYRTLRSAEQGNTELLTEKHKGTTYFTQKGEELIRESLAPIEPNDNQRSSMKNNEEQCESVELLLLKQQNEMLIKELEREKEEVSELKSELKIERENSRNMMTTLAELTQNSQELTRDSHNLTKNSQLLQLKQGNDTLLLSDERLQDASAEENNTQTKKPIWKKLFGNKKNDS